LSVFSIYDIKFQVISRSFWSLVILLRGFCSWENIGTSWVLGVCSPLRENRLRSPVDPRPRMGNIFTPASCMWPMAQPACRRRHQLSEVLLGHEQEQKQILQTRRLSIPSLKLTQSRYSLHYKFWRADFKLLVFYLPSPSWVPLTHSQEVSGIRLSESGVTAQRGAGHVSTWWIISKAKIRSDDSHSIKNVDGWFCKYQSTFFKKGGCQDVISLL